MQITCNVKLLLFLILDVKLIDVIFDNCYAV